MGKHVTFAGSSRVVRQKSEGATVLLSYAAYAGNNPIICRMVRTWKQGNVEAC